MQTVVTPRFSFPTEPLIPATAEPRRVRTAWISDVHLGTRGSNAALLLDFLREHEFETLCKCAGAAIGRQVHESDHRLKRDGYRTPSTRKN
jgi:hypothetical protein